MSFSELSVTIKDEEKRLNKKFAIYETISTDENDPIVNQCIEETLKNFDGTPDSVKYTITVEKQ